jgi:hypothetical protein
MEELCRLGLDGPNNGRMAVTKGADGNPGHKVEILLPGHIPDTAALSPIEDDRESGIGIGQAPARSGYQFP